MRIIAVYVVLVAVGLPAMPVSAQNTTAHILTVRRDSSTPLTNAQVDTAFVSAGDGTQVDDGANDISCAHGFARDGNVAVFANPPGEDCTVINGEAEFIACFLQPGFLKAIDELNWCGGPAFGAAGCAAIPGNSMVLVRDVLVGPVGGPLVNHEFGHATGLLHRDVVGNLIMNTFINQNSRRLNNAECTSIRSDNVDQDGPGGAALLAGQIFSPVEAGELDFTGIPIEELARLFFIESVPFEVEDYYTQDDVG